MTSDAEPLSDAEFATVRTAGVAWVSEETFERICAQAARVRELEAERDEIREHLNFMYESAIRQLHGVEAERDELQRQVEAARTALAVFQREPEATVSWPELATAIREAIVVLAPQTGEVGS